MTLKKNKTSLKNLQAKLLKYGRINYKTEDEKALQERMKIQEETLIFQEKIRELHTRIEKLIKVANACLENQIWFDTRNSYNRHKGFLADDITHLVGFIQDRTNLIRNRPIKYLGIRGVGADGKSDFITDGKIMYMSPYYDTNWMYFKKAPLGYLKRFVNEFDRFETSFYQYINDIVQFKQE